MQILSGNFSYTHNYRTHENFAKHVLNLRKKLFKFGEISSSALDCFRSQHSFFLKSQFCFMRKWSTFIAIKMAPSFSPQVQDVPFPCSSSFIKLGLFQGMFPTQAASWNQIKEFLIKFEKFRKLIVNQFW